MDSTLAKGLTVLEWLAREQRPCRVSEVADALNLARSNAHRTLQTLVACGWATQDETSAYATGLKLFELGALGGQLRDLRLHLRPMIERLAGETGETIHLAALEGGELVYLDKLDSPLPVAAYSRIGGRAPAYCVAGGKALLAALGEDIPRLQERIGTLHRHTPSSITTWDALLAELQATRERGYALNREEWRIGVCGLGAPVFDAEGRPVAAIGITVPNIRFGKSQLRVLAQRLVECAADASRSLGYAVRAQPASSLKNFNRRQP